MDKLSEAPEFLKPSELVEILPYGRDTVYRLLKLPSFPAVKIGRTYAVRKDSLIKWWNENEGKEIFL